MNDDGLFRDMIDKDIKIDIETLPPRIVEMIKELEELNAKSDWFFYDIKFDILENYAKKYVINNRMSESLYKRILAKYGGLYD